MHYYTPDADASMKSIRPSDAFSDYHEPVCQVSYTLTSRWVESKLERVVFCSEVNTVSATEVARQDWTIHTIAGVGGSVKNNHKPKGLLRCWRYAMLDTDLISTT